MKNFLIEGRPGGGKTTVMQTLAAQCGSKKIGGFLTVEIREGRERKGFRIETFAGATGTLAHVDLPAGPYVGKYRVDLAAFERIAVNGLRDALPDSDLLLIDEIGRMELLSNRFQRLVARCLDSPIPVVATVMQNPHSFLDQIKQRDDVRLIKLTRENREQHIRELVDQIES